MSVVIHPYKGYLNTLFHVQVTGTNAVEYRVLRISGREDTEIAKGKVYPNEPFSFQIPVPGEFSIECSDGTTIPLTVEDGYNYGGSKLKDAFIFDNCPWIFIVMHDRTYFYNRITQEAYVEAISPDKITALSSEYVILENKNHAERTIYSLKEQKPVLSISNIVFYNSEVIVWCEENNGSKILVLCSLSDRSIISRVIVDLFGIDDKSQRLIFSHESKIEIISLTKSLECNAKTTSFCGNIVDIVAPNIVISYEVKSYGKSLYIYDIDKDKLIKRIEIKGYLARIGNNQIVDVWKRKQAIQDFDITETEFPEAIISLDFFEFDFYPCEWEFFYTEKHIHLEKSNPYRVYRKEEYILHSCLKEFDQPLQSTFNHFLIYNDSICLYNDQESFVRNKTYSAAGYKNTGTIYKDGNHIYLYEENTIFTLSRNGYWDKGSTHKYDFKRFRNYGVIKNEDKDIIQSLSGYNYGKYKTTRYHKTESFLITDEAYIFPDRRILRVKEKDIDVPDFLSQSLKFGLTVDDDGVYLFEFDGQEYCKMKILDKLFDTSEYQNVLFSEDGSKVMHRNGDETIVMDVRSGEKQLFKNLSYVQHINGIRPAFEIDRKRQVILINPVTGLPIPNTSLSNHSFTSPDGSIYADTNLDAYIEYYHLIEKRIISKSEYDSLQKRYSYPFRAFEKDQERHKNVKESRERIVRANLSWFKSRARNVNDRSTDEWVNFFVDEKKIFDNEFFISFIVEKRGTAVIKKVKDDSEVARIKLGRPLWFLNYVSFSYDGRYIAIAGRYPNNTNDEEGFSLGGLFLCYDINNKEIILKKTDTNAVWTTAFTHQGRLAAYSSNPITFIASPNNREVIELMRYSFLTFSPDGQYFALSKKGYISKDSGKTNWGHQKSTEIFICNVNYPKDIICCYNDLSENGVATLGKRKENIASVAFSNNNRQLLMVGEDGVMIIRNLHLEDYASE